MKVVAFRLKDSHFKNHNAFVQMCNDVGNSLTICNEYYEIPEDTELIWSPLVIVHPFKVPINCQIVMGPQFFIFPDPHNELFYFNYNNEDRLHGITPKGIYNCLSPWIKEVYEEFIHGPRIQFTPLPFPIDTDQFKPLRNKKTNDAIIYFKNRDPKLKDATINILNSLKISYKVFDYALKYNENDYIDALQNSKYMIWIGRHESQGFALEECLACNVPIIVLDVESMYEEIDVQKMYETNSSKIIPHYTREMMCDKKLNATSVPYWDERCGIRITTIDTMQKSIEEMHVEYYKFEPREFVMEFLSSKPCWERWAKALVPK